MHQVAYLAWGSLLVFIGRSTHVVGARHLVGDPLKSVAHEGWGGEEASSQEPVPLAGSWAGDQGGHLVLLMSSCLPPLGLVLHGQGALQLGILLPKG